jgi:hypothetical protein
MTFRPKSPYPRLQENEGFSSLLRHLMSEPSRFITLSGEDYQRINASPDGQEPRDGGGLGARLRTASGRFVI